MTASYLRSRAPPPADPMRGFAFVEDGTIAKPGKDDADGKKRGVRLGWNDRLHGVAWRLLAPVDGRALPGTAPPFFSTAGRYSCGFPETRRSYTSHLLPRRLVELTDDSGPLTSPGRVSTTKGLTELIDGR